MEDDNLKLYLEINNSNLIFFVCKKNHDNNFLISHKLEVQTKGLENNRISDFDKVYRIIKENIYLIEKKFDITFKEIVLILDNFNPSFVNLSGYKKLNGSQITKENITYILNMLKSYVDNIETKKKILHIFNSNFYLDNKKIDNLPIGLFGDFYSHELSFVLVNKNDYKNLINVFDKCNLKIQKILLKSFVKGAAIDYDYQNSGTFFQIDVSCNNSKVFYFENSSLKFEQDFNFGTDIIINDILKITSLCKSTVKKILNETDLHEELEDDTLIEENFFEDDAYRKIKKKLIYEIILARAQEIIDLMIFKNINFKHYNETPKDLYYEFSDKSSVQNIKEIYKNVFLKNGLKNVESLNGKYSDEVLKAANKVVHFGWKKEAIPITQTKKSIIARFFEAIFG